MFTRVTPNVACAKFEFINLIFIKLFNIVQFLENGQPPGKRHMHKHY